MKIQKRIVRKWIFPLAMNLGLDKFFRNRSGNAILNVMYHGVVESDSCYFSPSHLTLVQFEEQLKYLTENFEIISTDEAFTKIKNKEKLDKKYITVTFDDGYKNNLISALPLLEKYKVPTTFFISSICIEEEADKFLWLEITSALGYFNKNDLIEVNSLIFKNLVCKEKNISLPDYIKNLSYEERDLVLKHLVDTYNVKSNLESLPEEIWKLMNKQELSQLAQSKFVTIGSHGHRHFNLANIKPEFAEEELRISKIMLEEITNSEVNLIGYPDGSYNEEVKDIAEKLGYIGQFAVNYKSPKDFNDLRIMNRHGVSSTTTFESIVLFLNRAFKKKGVI